MNCLAKIFESGSKTLLNGESFILNQIRGKTKKAKGGSAKPSGNRKPKHRGWKVQDNHFVTEKQILVLQRTLRFHPGLNVGFGKNGTLFALTPGRVVVTAETINPNWEHTWIQRIYAGREDQRIWKKHFNVIPFAQHNRFRLIDEV